MEMIGHLNEVDMFQMTGADESLTAEAQFEVAVSCVNVATDHRSEPPVYNLDNSVGNRCNTINYEIASSQR